MGQGYSLTTLSAGSAGIDVPEMADLTYEQSLGTARFMKCIRAKHRDGLVVAKVVMKPYASIKLDEYVRVLLRERKALADVPNALGYHRILETSTNGYLVRQYIHNSLYDKISTRPFLEGIEKKWLAFQLLCAVRDCHARDIFHGDIKTENVLVTSWNWLYLADFSSSFKPTYLPIDNPADFSFYFDTSGRRTCYLAPERFLNAGAEPEGDGTITWAMDIFSVGCVIAELFLEAPIFDLSQLFQYRQDQYDPKRVHFSKITDSSIRDLVVHMTQLEPNSRMSAEDYLNWMKELRGFPDYFFEMLHQYMYTITDPTSGRKQVTSGTENFGECDDRIDEIFSDFDKIMFHLNAQDDRPSVRMSRPAQKADGGLFPLVIDIPNYQHEAANRPGPSDDGTLIFLMTVESSLRGTAKASSRIRAFELLLAFAEQSTDEAKLDRILPYIATHLEDKADMCSLVSVASPINANVFPEYILPSLNSFLPPPPDATDSASLLMRITYASCIGTLATTAARNLDKMQALRVDVSLPDTEPEVEEDDPKNRSNSRIFDLARADLMSQIEVHTKALLTDADFSVRRAMLGSVADLYWLLRKAFFETIVSVAVYVGAPSLEEYILPLMVQGLTDPEEFVIDRVIRSFSTMAELGLFQRSKTWELVDIVARFTMHPNSWIREAAAQFISVSTSHLSIADTNSILFDLIKVYFTVKPSEYSELKILDSLKKPLPRIILEMASTWAIKAEKGLFWLPPNKKIQTSSGSSREAGPTVSARDLTPKKALSRITKNDEDEKWLTRLRNAGMNSDEEFKLVALKDYIWRVAHRKRNDDKAVPISMFNDIVALNALDVIPHTVLFDQGKELLEKVPTPDTEMQTQSTVPPRTIADALLDASTTEEWPATRARASLAERLTREESALGRGSSPTPPKLSSSPSAAQPPQIPPLDVESRRSSLQVPRSDRRAHDSPNGQSPVGSVGGITFGDHNHGLRHKNSAMSLLNMGDNKAHPETGTTSTNAFGKVDGVSTRESRQKTQQPSQLAAAQAHHRQSPSRIRYKESHNYTGNDRNILRLLDSLYLQNYPADDIEFGPQVQSVDQQPIKRGNGQPSSSANPWRPEGTLVAMIGEHTAAVSRILVAADHSFFITGSDDGSVKVWDSWRLERNITHRSRQTFKLNEGAKVTSLAFIENTYSFVCTGSDGSVFVVRVDYQQLPGGGTKYGRLKMLREYQLPEGEHAVWSDHYKSDVHSVLMLATNNSRIIALELRTMTELYVLENPLQHGTPTCFCLDRRQYWLLLGTSHGVIDLWDLRFRLRLKAWAFQGSSPIHRIIHQSLGRSKFKVHIAGGTGQGEVTVWNMEKLVCKEVYHTGLCKNNRKGMSLIDVDEEGPGGMLGRFATSLEPDGNVNIDRGIRAMVIRTQPTEKGKDYETKQLILLTAGPDWKVRFWDTVRPEASTVVSGMELDEGKPQYSTGQLTTETFEVRERLSLPQGQQSSSSGRDGSRASSNTSAKRGSTKPSRSSIISLQQQHLLRSHMDSILDVALLEYPYGMVISADRSGVIYVFQ
ncbi:uncharacterized protein BDZ99DRAFT_542462 [Mytilinidion resinicola]|uniref:non-specific serine/threonine protein kinase n=1 Tax=Mytilinidion resinicola TaxID=574789 RepID=A0A6A6Z590_9PEZI|nr:uncharacterized protein BDZ99DRAFT_542462 [Mytilinidion resinicola]KAF2816190.1 hypothetical protein BDZ99DRAFT_542462 [Mytilinidion resinicola]